MTAHRAAGVGDFDFLIGRWNIVNRRLRRLFEGSDDWEEYASTSTAISFFDGQGSFDEVVFPTKDSSGCAFRLYDASREEWSIWWATNRPGLLYPPVTGRFVDGRGDFYGDDTHEGRPIRVHFRWSDITPVTARWEQEFSPDGGATWELNWTMELSRIS